ncbi:MAG: STAS domain-containing protein [Magnetococcales bacterium]|nr:STAS domain-containing protein [Magnetococcales bacterium]
MSITASKTENRITISISGSFDFKMRTPFRKAYISESGKLPFVVDFANVDFIDSSALGMLLMLREHCGGNDSDITLINCKAEIKRLFQISQFKDLFHLK